jgi:UDP-N-acetylglucosamine 2-epimerase
VCFTGNVMIDSLHASRPQARPAADTCAHMAWTGLLEQGAGYGVVTLHRPSNVDDADTLRGLLERCWRGVAAPAAGVCAAPAHAQQHRALRPGGPDRPAAHGCCCRPRATWRCWA